MQFSSNCYSIRVERNSPRKVSHPLSGFGPSRGSGTVASLSCGASVCLFELTLLVPHGEVTSAPGYCHPGENELPDGNCYFCIGSHEFDLIGAVQSIEVSFVEVAAIKKARRTMTFMPAKQAWLTMIMRSPLLS